MSDESETVFSDELLEKLTPGINLDKIRAQVDAVRSKSNLEEYQAQLKELQLGSVVERYRAQVGTRDFGANLGQVIAQVKALQTGPLWEQMRTQVQTLQAGTLSSQLAGSLTIGNLLDELNARESTSPRRRRWLSWLKGALLIVMAGRPVSVLG